MTLESIVNGIDLNNFARVKTNALGPISKEVLLDIKKRFNLIPAFSEFYEKSARYKVAYGGRGSGKSETFARCMLLKALEKPVKILNTRAIQDSIADSVHGLYTDIIRKYNLERYFKITRAKIKCINGSELIFKGLNSGLAENIKSIQNINYCWIEEGAAVDIKGLETLLPTVREEKSEIWISFNPRYATDPVYERYVEKQENTDLIIKEDAALSSFAKSYDKIIIVKKINYTDNPYFPDALRVEMALNRSVSEALYRHVWEGELDNTSEECFFKDVKVEAFDKTAKLVGYIDPSYGGPDYTGFCFGYWKDGRAYVWVYEEKIDFSNESHLEQFVNTCNTMGIVKLIVEKNADKGVAKTYLRTMFRRFGAKTFIQGVNNTREKTSRILEQLMPFREKIIINIDSDFLCVHEWQEAVSKPSKAKNAVRPKRKHDDGIDALCGFIQFTHKQGI